MDSKTLPIITTPRLVLRWISENDIDSLYEIFSDPQVMRYWSTVPLPNLEAAAELQREIAEGNESERMLKWGLALRDSDKVIGTTTLFNLISTMAAPSSATQWAVLTGVRATCTKH
jgi:RimJ/RimL family protein N-acetyltransferase